MGFIRMDEARREAPIVLNLIKDTGWCYAWGMISVVTIIPVLSFQVYEIWKSRKDGSHKVVQNIMGTLAVMANGTWMVSDIFFHDHYRVYARWIFAISFIFLGLYFIFAYRHAKTDKKDEPRRVMVVSKQTRDIMFVHGRLSHLHRKPSFGSHVLMAKRRELKQ